MLCSKKVRKNVKFGSISLCGSLPVACNGLESAVIPAQWDIEPDNGLASLDKVQVLFINASHVGCFIVEKLDLLKETRLLVHIHFGSKLLSGEETAHS